MIFNRGSKACNGCELYGEDCHCLCHEKDLVNGFHEIVYAAGEAPILHEVKEERD